MNNWFKISEKFVELKIFVKPNAQRTAILAIDERGLNIALHAQPKDNEANQELIKFLAKLFKIPKSEIIIKSGELSRHKLLKLPLSELLEKALKNPSLILSQS